MPAHDKHELMENVKVHHTGKTMEHHAFLHRKWSSIAGGKIAAPVTTATVARGASGPVVQVLNAVSASTKAPKIRHKCEFCKKRVRSN